MSLIYLYSYRLPVQLSMTNHQAPNYNRPMINYNTKIYKNNYNIIDFVVRNNDRRPVKLVDCQLSVVIEHAATQTVVLEKACQIVDEVKGRAQVVLTSNDTSNWSLGGYRYQVKITRPYQSQEFLYTDINNSTIGNFDLYDSVGGTLIPAKTMKGSELTPFTVDWDEMKSWLVSGAIPAENSVGNNTGLFTIALYQTQWQGRFKIQASLENLAPTERSWFTVELSPGEREIVFDGTGPTLSSYTFSLNCRWIRFVFVPDPINRGRIDKIVYKIS
jgi:hypothetical protein